MSAHPRDTMLVAAARTPVGRFNGALRGYGAKELGAHAIAEAIRRAGGLTPDRIFLGNVVQAGNGQNPARAAAVLAGLPTTVPGTTLNDVCPASISSVTLSSSLIRGGDIDSALVGGFESMSRAPHGIQVRQARTVGEPEVVDLLVSEGLWCSISGEGMGPISERANAELGIGRLEQDEVALASHVNAQRARVDALLADEIVPLPELDHDEGVRPDASMAALTRLKPAFVEDGTITAGNASQMSDAGAAGVVMAREVAKAQGLEPLVQVVGSTMIAGPDETLHLKPAVASRRLLETHGLPIDEVGVWEINEAFAGVVIASVRDLGLDMARVNPHGGAIAVGHPLAASGFRLVMAAATTMRQTGSEWGVATLCGGGGQGAAVLLRLPG